MDAREFIRERIKAGETQHEIARKCGFSQGLVYKIINTSAPITFSTKMKIAHGYHLPPSTFIDELSTGPAKLDDPEKYRQYAKTIEPQPVTISEQLHGYSPEVRIAADYLEVKVKGKTAEERMAFIEEIMDEIRQRIK
jgi:transcriptional regulator with XRE-family HTH domain